MRIVVNGQQAFGKAVVETLIEQGEEVIAVYCAPDKEGRPADPLKLIAQERGIPVFQPRSFRKEEVWAQFRELKPDVCMMAYVTLFVPEPFLDIPTHGTFQYHPSLLPRHRGPSSINWPIIQGADRTGLTIFWPNEGLDTGPVLLQKEVPIGEDDTLGSLYFDHLFPMGVAAMLESLELVRQGKAPRIVQDEAAHTYESWCKAEDVQLDWSKPTREVYNMIRGANPQPGAWSLLEGQTLQIFDAGKVEGDAGGSPGDIVAVEANHFAVATADGKIIIKRVKPAGAKKMDAGQCIQEQGLKTGMRLGN